MIINPNPDQFPAIWASAWGEDIYGLWQAFEVDGVHQAVRWIPPGQFLMGSPPNELRHYLDEIQHSVILSEGYWLADTACTQALWQAVIGRNPSKFSDNLENPVECVSWDDVQMFLGRLNRLVKGNLCASLPTEAQWEYACRAGTTTPFSFGHNITTDQVNYNGHYLYADGRKGEYRRQTLRVHALPANPWGLYQMHGNVWEWCQDGYADYPETSVIDPVGPSISKFHMVRGGSWLCNAGYLRSAYRSGGGPNEQGTSLGFRLCLAQHSF